jgi:hypothetical protein
MSNQKPYEWRKAVDPWTGRPVWGRTWPNMDTVDEYGRVWRKPSDILERQELADPDPQPVRRRKRATSEK